MGAFLAVMGLAALLGGMLFFGTIMTPLVFGKLPPDISGPFIRATFPRYYLYVVITSLVAALGLLIMGKPWYALAAILVTGATLWLWLEWIPHINALRDSGPKAAFDRAHKLSVYANGVEFIVVLLLLAGIAV
jgi:hypothetical protein